MEGIFYRGKTRGGTIAAAKKNRVDFLGGMGFVGDGGRGSFPQGNGPTKIVGA